ncbi:hypothetical protein ACPA9J_14405 [Pseudomonas aeruginosa]
MNGYGPTENTTFTCCHVVTNDDLEEDDIPIGNAIAGTVVSCSTSTDRRSPSPTGPGDRRLRRRPGAGLSERCGAHPLLASSRIAYRGRLLRAYRTGDRAQGTSRAGCGFIGRGDGQVKLNGYRLDLPALEQRFRRQPGILDCALLVRERNGVEQLCSAPGREKPTPAHRPCSANCPPGSARMPASGSRPRVRRRTASWTAPPAAPPGRTA